jgi:hypothetical protein
MSELDTHAMNEYYENYEPPWWFRRCTHNVHAYWQDPEGKEYGCWRVLREAEQVVILQQLCLPKVHVLVDIAGVGSICKSISRPIYEAMSQSEVLALVQSQTRDLRILL